MKKIIKIFLRIFIFVFIAAAAYCGAFAYTGYKMYEEVTAACPVETKAEEIRACEGFTPYSELPEFYIKAVIAAEDRRFDGHGGVDFLAVGRAVLHDIQAGAPVEGGSTITQQLAKNLYFSQEKKLERKFAEAFTAFEIEKKFTKNEIFELYVNSIYFGSGYYGISAAAEGYCQKAVPDLTDYECALLAGIPNAPSAYSPDTAPELAKQRLAQVLKNMTENGDIDTVAAKKILDAE